MKKIKFLLISLGVMLIVSVVLLLISALIFEKTTTLPQNTMPIIVTVIGCVAVFLGALVASLLAKENGILYGLLTGLIYSLCIAFVSVCVFKNDFTFASLGKFTAFLLSGAIGGILGVNRKSKVKF